MTPAPPHRSAPRPADQHAADRRTARMSDVDYAPRPVVAFQRRDRAADRRDGVARVIVLPAVAAALAGAAAIVGVAGPRQCDHDGARARERLGKCDVIGRGAAVRNIAVHHHDQRGRLLRPRRIERRDRLAKAVAEHPVGDACVGRTVGLRRAAAEQQHDASRPRIRYSRDQERDILLGLRGPRTAAHHDAAGLRAGDDDRVLAIPARCTSANSVAAAARMQPHAAMRGGTAEARNVVGAVDRVALVEEDRMRHRRAVVAGREPAAREPLWPEAPGRRAVAAAAGRDRPNDRRSVRPPRPSCAGRTCRCAPARRLARCAPTTRQQGLRGKGRGDA